MTHVEMDILERERTDLSPQAKRRRLNTDNNPNTSSAHAQATSAATPVLSLQQSPTLLKRQSGPEDGSSPSADGPITFAQNGRDSIIDSVAANPSSFDSVEQQPSESSECCYGMVRTNSNVL
jgi:hypothetical protein